MGRVIVIFFLFSIIIANQADAQTTFSTATSFPAGSKPNSVSAVDFNGDGMPDLAAANYDSDNISVLLNTTAPGAVSPAFSSCVNFAAGVKPYSVSVSDINGDGLPDIAVANSGSNTVSVLPNTTARGAAAPAFASKADFNVGASPTSVSICDLNGDGKPDLAVANNGSNTVSVLLNTTSPGAISPTFSSSVDFTAGTEPNSVTAGDINGDGKPDLAVVCNKSNAISVFLNNTAPGSITPVFSSGVNYATGSYPSSVNIGDINGDGKPDLAVPSNGSSAVSVFLNSAVLPLPVELTSFTASATGNKVTLNWNTATEENNYGFGIERGVMSSELGVLSYEKIGFVSGAGNSNSVKEYSFIDNAAKAGRYSYRLKQIDNDGTYKYSGEREITIAVPKEFALNQNYPNPFNPTTTIKYDIAAGSQYFVTLRVFDIVGREVATLVNEVKEPGRYTTTFDASGFSSGIYYCRMQAGTYTATKKLLLIK